MRLPRWKREQKMRRRQKVLLFLRPILLLIFLSVLSLVCLLFIRQWRSSALPSESRATIVFGTEPVIVASFDSQKELTLLLIPAETYLEVTRGFGSYRVGAVWQLGELDPPAGGGGELLKETTQEFLGGPIDGWIGAVGDKWQITGSEKETLALKNNLTSWKILLKPKESLGILRNLQTNLTIFDLVKLWFWAKNTRFDKIHFVDLEQTSALSTLILADGSTAKTFDQALLDAVSQGLFKDSQISNEHVLIEVLNGTDKPGFGQRVSRLITNLGGEVVSVANSPQKVSESQIKAEAGVLQTFTSRRLGQIFNCVILAEKPKDSRADLQIIVGEEYWRKLFQR